MKTFNVEKRECDMKSETKRRPYCRPHRSIRKRKNDRGSSQNPVFQPLEPRRLLTTLYANPDPTLGQTNVFTGLIAMPKFITDLNDIATMDAGDVESRSVRVQISIFDPDPNSAANVTILDLDGNTLFPWLGQPDGNGGFNTEIEIAYSEDPLNDGPAFGDDGFWGTEDDQTVSGFGLDMGFIPGWKFLAGADQTLFTADDVIVPDAYFNPVRVLTFEEDQESEKVADFDFDGGVPPEVSITGSGNVVWTTNDVIGVKNYTSGESLSLAADVNQGVGSFDTSAQFGASLSAWTAGRLDFNLNYQNNGNDRLSVDVSTDNGSNWTTVKTYTDDVGSFRTEGAGQDQSIDISAFAGNDILVRYRYTDPDGNALYAQVDDITVTGFLSGWDTGNVPGTVTRVIPQTGFWDPGADGIYNGGGQFEGFYPSPFVNSVDANIKNFGWFDGADDFRLPTGFDGGGNDERFPKGEDGSTWIELDPTDQDPWRKPTLSDTEFHLIDLPTNLQGNPDLQAWADANPDRARHTLGIPDDGIADFNNGIGQIIFSDTTSGTTFTMVVIGDDGLPVDPFAVPDESDIGVDIDRAPEAVGVIQPVAMGQIIIGNPTNADWTFDDPGSDILTFMPFGVAGRNMASGVGWQQWDFQSDVNFPDRLPEGISFADPSANESIGNINIDGSFFGVARFPGAVGVINVGYLGGKIVVDGELDGLIVAGDAAFIEYSDGLTTGDTGALVDVGRNIGSFIVGGTTSTELSVIGDVNDRVDRPNLRTAQQTILEYEVDLHNTDQPGHNVTFQRGNIRFILPTGGDSEAVQYVTNDTLGTAQFVGRLTGRSEVFGDLGGRPLIGPHTARDDVDTYAIAVDGRKELRLQILDPTTGLNYRAQLTVLDEFGNIIASRGRTGLNGEIVFTPDKAGVVYVQVTNTQEFEPNTPYRLIIQGLEAVTLGEYNAYQPMRFRADGSKGVVTKFGSIGTVRAGQDALEADNAWVGNLVADSAGDIWNITAGQSLGYNTARSRATGTDVLAPISITAAGDIGTIISGIANGGGQGLMGGSIVSGLISAGKDIGGIYAYASGDAPRHFGDLGGFSEDATRDTMTALISTLQIKSGGSIGVIHADNRIWGGTATSVVYGPSGSIDLLEASAVLVDSEHPGNRDLDMSSGFSGILGTGGTPLSLKSTNPSGSNVKFVRTPYAFSTFNNADAIEIGPDEEISLVDDSGAVFTVRVTAGTTFGGNSTSGARIVTQPVEGSQGVAVARIIANLHFGADLIITNNSGSVEIGDVIAVSNGQIFDSKSNIIFNGTGKTDVYMLRAVGQFDEIRNTTSGDIAAIDVGGVRRVKWSGNLGRVDGLLDIGPSILGPNLGIGGAPAGHGFGDDTGVQLIGGGAVQVAWVVGSALEFNPIAGVAPFDGILNGISIRENTFNDRIESISVGGALSDAIIQTTIERIIINDDNTTPFGDFHGLEGVVYSNANVEFINLGDGMLPHQRKGPSLTAGVTALGQVEHVLVEGEGHDLRGVVGGLGFGTFAANQQNVDFGVGLVEAKDGADIFGAIIATDSNLGTFWDPNGNNGATPIANIDKIQLRDGNLIDTIVQAVNIGTIDVNGGFWDTNLVSTVANIGKINADEIRDTTDTFSPIGTSFFGLDNQNAIIASGNLDRLETTRRAGDIRDLFVDLQGDLNQVRAFNFDGVQLNVDNVIGLVDAKGTIARSKFTTGTVDRIQAKSDIARLTVLTAGPIKKFTSKSGSMTRLDLVIDGPDAELKRLDAANDINGSIQVSGAISQIKTKTGDIDAFIRTFSGDGDVKKIQSGRDMLVELDIDGGLTQLKAGRNLGDGRRMHIRGDAKKIDGRKGVVDAQIIIEGELGNLVAGTWTSDGSITTDDTIKKVVINGTLDGSITSNSGGISKLIVNGAFGATGSISAFEAGIKSLTIDGDAAGTIFADKEISKVDVRAGNGMSGNLTGSVESADTIKSLNVSGNATGAYVQALHELQKAVVGGSVTDTIFGAGQTIKLVQINGLATDSYILAGLEDLGIDNALGGSISNTKDVFAGSATLEKAVVNGGIDNVVFAAGVTAGTDGLYSTVDGNTDLAPGKSVIESIVVGGTAVNGNQVLADTEIRKTSFADPNPDVNIQIIDADAPTLPGTGTQLQFSNGTPVSFLEADGDTVTLALSGNGTGTVEYDGSKNISGIIFTGTDNKTGIDITVTNQGNTGNGFVDLKGAAAVAAPDDADISSFNFGGNFGGSSSLSFDGNVDGFTARTANTTGTIHIGGTTKSMTFDSVSAGTFDLPVVETFSLVNGGFAGTLQSVRIKSFVATGDVKDATIFGRDEITSFKTSGAFGVDPQGPGFNPAYISSNVEIGSFTAASTTKATISAGDFLGNVTVNGNVVDTQFIAGMILGSDANFGGNGLARDRLTAGTVNRVNIKGNFTSSSIAAGINPGSDTYFATSDDLGALGFSSIDGVVISGIAKGSNTFSQSFAFITTGEMRDIKVSGNTFVEQGNLTTSIFDVTPVAPEVTDTTVRLKGKDFVADIFFSEDISESTVVPKQGGLSSISVVSAEGGIDPVEGTDYFVSFDQSLLRASVLFDRTFIQDNPGVYTITVDGSTLVSRAGVLLDGNMDGIVGDDYAFNVLVGDAGDRTIEGQDWDHDNDPSTPNVLFRASSNLDLVLDDLVNGTGTKNHEVSIVEIIGDHPENDSVFFPDKLDVDLYQVTLEAGDIIRADLAALAGSGFLGTLSLRDLTGSTVANANQLASGVIITGSNTYVLEVTGGGNFHLQGNRFNQDLNITNTTGFFDAFGFEITPDSVVNDIGRYKLNVLVFDDGDTGFDRATDLNILAGTTGRVESSIGVDDSIGFPDPNENAFRDVDIFRITVVETLAGTITELNEGTTVNIDLNVEEFGSDLGGQYEISIFKIDNPTQVFDASLVGAPVDRGNFGAKDTTYSIQIPETGEYAILVQGSINSNYALDVSVDLSTGGDRYAQPRTQNVLLELNGGRAEWLGRFGKDLSSFSLDQLGFENSENVVLASIIQAVESKFDNQGITVNVSTNVSDFDGEEFTTMFLTSNFGDENFFGGILGEAESLDPLNQNQAESAVIYVNAHNFFAVGQEQELADELANTITHELAHTLGLRHQNSLDDGLMGQGFLGVPLEFSSTDYSLREIMLGLQNEVQMLNWIFDTEV